MTRATELESRGNVFTPFTGCAQIYHQRWYVRSPRAPAEGGAPRAGAHGGATIPHRGERAAPAP